MKTKDLKKAKGITLIALVVTIIVLLILAGVSIMMLTGDNGILTNAQQTSTQSAYKGAEEQVKIAYMAVKTEIMAKTVEDGTYNPKTAENTAKLAEIVRKDLGTGGDGAWSVDGSKAGVIKILYTDSKIDAGVMGEATITKLGDTTDTVAIPREEGVVHYQINLLDTQDAKLYVDTADDIGVVFFGTTSSDSGVGYYADLDGDGTITLENDGIIFADLAVGASGTGLGQSYLLNAVTETNEIKLKKYEESTSTVTGEAAKFGEQKWIKAAGTTGKNRFYVMALKDIDFHYWYYNAYNYSGKTYITADGIGIDEDNKAVGRKNTEAIMAVYDKATDNGGWGLKATGQTYTDMFDVIKTKYESDVKWFVPSRDEWAAFAGATINGYNVGYNRFSFGVSDVYWSSSQYPGYLDYARTACFNNYTFGSNPFNYSRSVRLCTTF